MRATSTATDRTKAWHNGSPMPPWPGQRAPSRAHERAQPILADLQPDHVGVRSAPREARRSGTAGPGKSHCRRSNRLRRTHVVGRRLGDARYRRDLTRVAPHGRRRGFTRRRGRGAQRGRRSIDRCSLTASTQAPHCPPTAAARALGGDADRAGDVTRGGKGPPYRPRPWERYRCGDAPGRSASRGADSAHRPPRSIRDKRRQVRARSSSDRRNHRHHAGAPARVSGPRQNAPASGSAAACGRWRRP